MELLEAILSDWKFSSALIGAIAALVKWITIHGESIKQLKALSEERKQAIKDLEDDVDKLKGVRSDIAYIKGQLQQMAKK